MPGLSDWYWIRESGECAEADLPGLVRAFAGAEDCAIAFYTDHFQAADTGHIPALLTTPETLLEIRVIRKDAEFWAHRTGAGVPFSWRTADELSIWERAGEKDYETAMNLYTLPARHILDISPDYTPYRDGEQDEFGCRKLRSSIGGLYTLPLGDAKEYGYVKLVNYVSYSGAGIAGIADFRIAGFDPL